MGSARAICWFSPPVRYQRKGVFYHSYSPFWTTAPSVITNRAKFVCFSFYRQFIIKNTNLQYHSRIFSSGFSLVAIWFWKGVEDTNKRNKFSNPLYIVPPSDKNFIIRGILTKRKMATITCKAAVAWVSFWYWDTYYTAMDKSLLTSYVVILL